MIMFVLIAHICDVCSWQVEDEVGEISMVIVQNKIDLIDDAVVQPWVAGRINTSIK